MVLKARGRGGDLGRAVLGHRRRVHVAAQRLGRARPGRAPAASAAASPTRQHGGGHASSAGRQPERFRNATAAGEGDRQADIEPAPPSGSRSDAIQAAVGAAGHQHLARAHPRRHPLQPLRAAAAAERLGGGGASGRTAGQRLSVAPVLREGPGRRAPPGAPSGGVCTMARHSRHAARADLARLRRSAACRSGRARGWSGRRPAPASAPTAAPMPCGRPGSAARTTARRRSRGALDDLAART